MLAVGLGVLVAACVASFVYVIREGLGLQGLGLAALRTMGLGSLLLLLVNPGNTVRVSGGAPVVLLDESLSMGVNGGKWHTAMDTARAIAGTGGTIIKFGSGLSRFDTLPPSAGASHLDEAVRAARASGGPVYVVTDGEIDDAATIAPSLLQSVTTILLPRDTLLNAALLDVQLPNRVQLDDSIRVVLTIGTWNSADTSRAELDVLLGNRVVRTMVLRLPPSPGVAKRTLTLRPRVLPLGPAILHFRLKMEGDSIAGDDERVRVVTVTRQRPVVVLVDPSDWEGRFLVTELSAILESNVQSYARISSDRWVDTRTLEPVSQQTVRTVAANAGLLVTRGGAPPAELPGARRRPVWHWPASSDTLTEFFPGDWYLTGVIPPSPLGRRLGGIESDSLPPLTGMIPLVPAANEWVALTARRGRRGAERAVLLGRDSAGARRLVTAGAGLWRWSFRGGAAREAYKAVLSAGVDWLLGSNVVRRSVLSASPVVVRGDPTVFRWTGDSIPDTLVVSFIHEGGTDPITATLRFDISGVATWMLDPGVYSWSISTPRLSGQSVVERYSDEYHPRPVTIRSESAGLGTTLIERFARERWWLFVVVVAAFAVEWGLRHRRGLP